MLATVQPMTAEAFDRFIDLPENAEKLFELIGGVIVEVPSNPTSSEFSMEIAFALKTYLREHNLGHLTGEAGGYWVNGERYAPDVAFIAYEKGELAKQGYNPQSPDLAVEVDYPSTQQSQRTLTIKVVNYLAAGTTVWMFIPEDGVVVVFAPGQKPKTLDLNGELDGGSILPGFKLPVKAILKAEMIIPRPADPDQDEG